jgi:hypothetical protein
MAAAWIVALAPILLIVAAVALVAYGIIKLIKHWDQVKREIAGRSVGLHQEQGDRLRRLHPQHPGPIGRRVRADFGRAIIDVL